MSLDTARNLEKAAQCGEPSYIWQDGQERRLQMILQGVGECVKGRLLENGCGVGMYVEHLLSYIGEIVGLEFEFERAVDADRPLWVQRTGQSSDPGSKSASILCGAGEWVPFPDESFRSILSHEVLEHVQDDRAARMNYPGNPSGNWSWRMPEDVLNEGLCNRIKEINYLYSRENRIRSGLH